MSVGNEEEQSLSGRGGTKVNVWLHRFADRRKQGYNVLRRVLMLGYQAQQKGLRGEHGKERAHRQREKTHWTDFASLTEQFKQKKTTRVAEGHAL